MKTKKKNQNQSTAGQYRSYPQSPTNEKIKNNIIDHNESRTTHPEEQNHGPKEKFVEKPTNYLMEYLIYVLENVRKWDHQRVF